MAEVIRLVIIYETERAASNLTRLERGQRGASTAALHLAQGLAQGNISAVTLARSVEHLGGSVGLLATGVGLAAGAFVVWSNFLDKNAERAAALAKELAAAKVTLDGLLGIQESSTEVQIRHLTDRIKELEAEINKPGFLQKLGTLLSTVGKVFVGFESVPQGLKELGFGGADPRREALAVMKEQRNILQRLLETQTAIANGRAPGGLGPMHFRDTSPGGAAFNRPVSFHPGPSAPFGGGFGSARGLDLATHPATPLVDAQVEELTRQQQRIVDSWTAGLETMQGSLEEFLVTGKFVFQQLIDDLLRIAFRAATDQFVDKAVKGVLDVAQKSSGFRKQMSGG